MAKTTRAAGPATREAVCKAGGPRLRADMAHAARVVNGAVHSYRGSPLMARAYVLGAIEAEASATRRACLVAAWGA